MDSLDTGLLLNKQNITLHRQYFKQMCSLLGMKVLYYEPRPNSKTYNGYGELTSFYKEPIQLTCIFDEHPNQKSMKKLGWNAELQENPIVIHVPYDLQGVQAGALFEIPAGIDGAEPRRFRVIQLSNIAVYPCSISCELALEWKNEQPESDSTDFRSSNFNLLSEPVEEEY